jgi:hypothetical protein
MQTKSVKHTARGSAIFECDTTMAFLNKFADMLGIGVAGREISFVSYSVTSDGKYCGSCTICLTVEITKHFERLYTYAFNLNDNGNIDGILSITKEECDDNDPCSDICDKKVLYEDGKIVKTVSEESYIWSPNHVTSEVQTIPLQTVSLSKKPK